VEHVFQFGDGGGDAGRGGGARDDGRSGGGVFSRRGVRGGCPRRGVLSRRSWSVGRGRRRGGSNSRGGTIDQIGGDILPAILLLQRRRLQRQRRVDRDGGRGFVGAKQSAASAGGGGGQAGEAVDILGAGGRVGGGIGLGLGAGGFEFFAEATAEPCHFCAEYDEFLFYFILFFWFELI